MTHPRPLIEAWADWGLAEDPTPDTVNALWRVKRSALHPDKNPGVDPMRWHLAMAVFSLLLDYAERSVPCPQCAGTGKRSVARGFGHVRLPCDRCGMTGSVKRYPVAT